MTRMFCVKNIIWTLPSRSLVSLAKTKLPRVMGSRYANIVTTCLTCLDPDNADFGDTLQFEGQDGFESE